MPVAVLALIDWMYARMNDLFGWLISLGLSGKLKWVARDWIALVVAIVLLGLVIDGAVYIVRYRPYRRWKRALVRLADGLRGGSGKEAAKRGRGSVKSAALEEGGSVRGERALPPPAEEPVTQPGRRAHTAPSTRTEPAAPRPSPTRTGPAAERTRAAAPQPAPDRPTKKSGPSSAELFQPAPPMEEYDGEPRTYEPAKKTPDWRRVDE